MTSEHTPAPWHVDALDGTVYAANHRTVPQNDADARLIAAAPDLLAALAEAAPRLEQALIDEPEDYDNHELRAVCSQIRAAIAKATGG